MSQAKPSRRNKDKSRSRSGKGKPKKPATPSPNSIKPVNLDSERDPNLNFGAVLLGMITTLVLLFGVFGIGSERIKRPISEAEKTARAKAREMAEEAEGLDQLMISLAELKAKNDGELVEKVDLCEQRIEIAGKIIEKKPEKAYIRQTAIVENLLAHVKLYGLDFQNRLNLSDCGTRLEEAYKPYLEDTDQKVYSNAQVARLTHKSFEKIKEGAGDDLADLVGLFTEVVQRFPDDQYVASMIEAHLIVLVGSDRRYAERMIAQIRAENPEGTMSQLMEGKFRNAADAITLNEANFERKFTDRWANGRAGREELMRTSMELLAKPRISLSVINRVSAYAIWLEQNGWYKEAIELFNEIAKCPQRGNLYEEFHDKADAISASGVRRCNLIGKEIFFRGVDSAGKALNDATLKERVVIVAFWSESSPESVTYLEGLNQGTKTLANKPVAILAVCLDKELNRDLSICKSKSPMIRIIPFKTAGEPNSLYQSCPPSTLPHVMLVGFGGKVHDVSVDPMDARNEALNLLINRRR